MGRGRLPQASAVPYRMRTGQAEFLLITTRKGNWIFPKGIIDAGDTAEDTARKEAYEEAGVRGAVRGPSLCSYRYEKWDSICEVAVFLLEVEGEEPEWPESGERRRGWFRFEEARRLLGDRKKLLKVLDRARDELAARPPGSPGASAPGT